MEAILASRARAITAELPCVTVVLPVVIAFTGPARWADNNGLVAAVFPARRTCETPPGHTGGAFFFFVRAPCARPRPRRGAETEGTAPACRALTLDLAEPRIAQCGQYGGRLG